MRTSLLAAAGFVCWASLAVPAPAQPILNRIEEFVRDQIDATNRQKTAPAEPGYLGLIGDEAEQPGSGVRVIEVYPNQPAARGGLRIGDLITKVDGHPVRNMDSLGAALDGKGPGTRVSVVVERSGAQQPLDVTLGRRPQDVGPPPTPMPPQNTLPPQNVLPPPNAVPPQNMPDDDRAAEDLPEPTPATPQDAPRPRLGVRTVPVTDEVRQLNNLPDNDGGQVISVTVGSAADRAGIPLGAVIRAVDGQPVRTPQELAAAMRIAAGPTVELSYVADRQAQRKLVDIGSLGAADEGPQLELRPGPPQPNPITAARRPTVEVPPQAPAELPPPAATVEEPQADTPAQPTPAKHNEAAGDDASEGAKVQALERRVRELEARIKALEAERAADKPADG